MTRSPVSIPEGLGVLAERCEAASGPDAELDKIIWLTLGKCLHLSTSYEAVQGDSGHTCKNCGADSWGNLGKFGQKLHDSVPEYTASLDSAMSLVPEGWFWLASNAVDSAPGGIASVAPPWDLTDRPVEAATVALALVSAALKALSLETGR